MKKQIFIETVRREAEKLPARKALLAYALALDMNEDSLPADPIAAAKYMVSLIALVRREIPARSI